jgi:hypothetical protein
MLAMLLGMRVKKNSLIQHIQLYSSTTVRTCTCHMFIFYSILGLPDQHRTGTADLRLGLATPVSRVRVVDLRSWQRLLDGLRRFTQPIHSKVEAGEAAALRLHRPHERDAGRLAQLILLQVEAGEAAVLRLRRPRERDAGRLAQLIPPKVEAGEAAMFRPPPRARCPYSAKISASCQ